MKIIACNLTHRPDFEAFLATQNIVIQRISVNLRDIITAVVIAFRYLVLTIWFRLTIW